MRPRLLLVALGLVVGVTLTGGVWVTTELRTTLASREASGGITRTVKPGTTYTALIDGVCVDGRAEVTVDRIRAAKSHGDAKIGGFALGSHVLVPGTFNRRPAAKFFPSIYSGGDRSRTVGMHCAEIENLTSVAVEVSAETLPAAIEGFLIDYTVHGLHKTVRSDFFVTLCSGHETAATDIVPDSEDSNLSPCREWND